MAAQDIEYVELYTELVRRRGASGFCTVNIRALYTVLDHDESGA